MPDWLWFGLLVMGFGALIESYTRERRRRRIEDYKEPDDAIGRWLHDDGEPMKKDPKPEDTDDK